MELSAQLAELMLAVALLLSAIAARLPKGTLPSDSVCSGERRIVALAWPSFHDDTPIPRFTARPLLASVGMCSLERSLIKLALSFGLDPRNGPDKSRCPICICLLYTSDAADDL